ncbi:thioredoxin family protein [Candidatus Zixiibacteriota bacterium]
MRRIAHPTFLALALAVLLPATSAVAAPYQQEEAAEEVPVYDESADAATDITAALEIAAKENKRVLIQWGANWCGWCKLLHGTFQTDRTVSRTLLYEYEVVYVDIGRWDKNLELAEKFGADFQSNGVPYLTVLDSEGNVVTHQETGSLEKDNAHDPELVNSFLTEHQAEYLEAEDLLNDALAEAGRTHKRVFLTFGAPW